MLVQYLVEGEPIPWRANPRPYGVVIQGKSYLDGSDGGPLASCASFPEDTGSVAHFHTCAQFQVVLGGAMAFPTHRVEAPGVHYTDHCVPYGPFKVTRGHQMFVLEPKRGAQVFMADALKSPEKKQLINRGGRYYARSANEMRWEPLPGQEGARRKVLSPLTEGPSAEIVMLPPDREFTCGVPLYGQFEIVLEGSVTVGGRRLGPTGLRFLKGDEQSPPVRTGPEGAIVMVLSYDRDAEWSAPIAGRQ